MTRLVALLALVALASPTAPDDPPPAQDWPQFGGPTRDFNVQVSGLSPWKGDGPKVLWQRDLGDGYSGIAAAEGVLYTMYRPSARLGLTTADPETVVALDAATGKTLWEQTTPVTERASMNMEYGPGPHSTPLLAGGRLFTAGVVGRLQALDPKTGTVLWSRELWDELGGKVMARGYSCSALAWRDTVVVSVGGSGPGLVAFDQKDGSIRWKSPAFDVSPSSPVLIDVEGQAQIVFFAVDEVIGFEAESGRRLWSYPHQTTYGLNIVLPVAGDDGMLVVSSAYSGGTRALRLSREGDATTVEELWFSNRMKVHHGNFIRIGDHIYGSSGDFGPTPLSALDLRTGEVVWRDRAFAKAKLVQADGRLVVLDEDGSFGIVRVSPQGLEVEARSQVFSERSWTAPTLVGPRSPGTASRSWRWTCPGDFMKVLSILRHAKSSWKDASLDDHDRPSTSGVTATRRGWACSSGNQGLVPDAIVSSTARRARRDRPRGGRGDRVPRRPALPRSLYEASPGAHPRGPRRPARRGRHAWSWATTRPSSTWSSCWSARGTSCRPGPWPSSSSPSTAGRSSTRFPPGLFGRCGGPRSWDGDL